MLWVCNVPVGEIVNVEIYKENSQVPFSVFFNASPTYSFFDLIRSK